jgi:hypothetical protein
VACDDLSSSALDVVLGALRRAVEGVLEALFRAVDRA